MFVKFPSSFLKYWKMNVLIYIYIRDSSYSSCYILITIHKYYLIIFVNFLFKKKVFLAIFYLSPSIYINIYLYYIFI